jgi:hypothetical protein
MTLSRSIIILLLLTFSCRAESSKESIDPTIEKAKWYFYSYASSLTAYAQNESISPLACDIKLKYRNELNRDTTKVYFNLYKNDTVNFCSLKPYELVGITIIKSRLYLPIYNHVVFDDFDNDSIAFAFMTKQENLLNNKLQESRGNINDWLKENKQFHYK